MADQISPRRTGRPPKDPARHKRNRSISMTDDEYAHLAELAQAANRGISEYVIERLCLTKPNHQVGLHTSSD